MNTKKAGSTSTKPRKSPTPTGDAGLPKTPPRSKKNVDPCPCERIGKKRSDLRCRTPDGQEWASPLEARVFFELTRKGYAVERNTDVFRYSTAVKQGRCATCGSCSIVQDRTYTPDLKVKIPIGEGSMPVDLGSGMQATPYVDFQIIYLELKGYFAGPKRNLFRAARQSNPSADIRLIASTDHWVTKGKTRLSDWAKRFRIPFAVWNGTIPERVQ